MTRSHLVARQLQDTALRYFLEVVRGGSIAVASQRLNVASSAISRHIAQLEDTLGVALFERHRRGMVPSPAGEILAGHALKASHEAERVVNDIEALQGVHRGRVRLASSEGFAMEFLPKLISDFGQIHPGIQFHLGVYAPAEATRRIVQGEADIGITMSRSPESGIKVEHLQPSPVLAIMRPTHPLARHRQLGVAQLLAYPLALPDTETTVRQLFDLACGRQRLKVTPALTSSYTSSLLGFLKHQERGITIAGEISVRFQAARGEFVCVRLKDRGLDLRNVEVQTLQDRTLSPAATAFLAFMKERLDPGDAAEDGGA